MVEHTDNQKKRGNAENKTIFYYIRYEQANVSRISALTCLGIIIASKSTVRRFFQFFYDRQRRRRRQIDNTDYLTPLTHTQRRVKMSIFNKVGRDTARRLPHTSYSKDVGMEVPKKQVNKV